MTTNVAATTSACGGLHFYNQDCIRRWSLLYERLLTTCDLLLVDAPEVVVKEPVLEDNRHTIDRFEVRLIGELGTVLGSEEGSEREGRRSRRS